MKSVQNHKLAYVFGIEKPPEITLLTLIATTTTTTHSTIHSVI